MPDVTYTIRAKSEDLTTYLREDASWGMGEKLEYDLEVDSDERLLNFGDIDRIRFFAVFSDSPVRVSFTEGTDTVNFEVQDMIVFSPTKEFVGALAGVSVASLGGVANVKIRIYGEAA